MSNAQIDAIFEQQTDTLRELLVTSQDANLPPATSSICGLDLWTLLSWRMALASGKVFPSRAQLALRVHDAELDTKASLEMAKATRHIVVAQINELIEGVLIRIHRVADKETNLRDALGIDVIIQVAQCCQILRAAILVESSARNKHRAFCTLKRALDIADVYAGGERDPLRSPLCARFPDGPLARENRRLWETLAYQCMDGASFGHLMAARHLDGTGGASVLSSLEDSGAGALTTIDGYKVGGENYFSPESCTKVFPAQRTTQSDILLDYDDNERKSCLGRPRFELLDIHTSRNHRPDGIPSPSRAARWEDLPAQHVNNAMRLAYLDKDPTLLLSRFFRAWERVVRQKRHWCLHDDAEVYVADLEEQSDSPKGRSKAGRRHGHNRSRIRNRQRRHGRTVKHSRGPSTPRDDSRRKKQLDSLHQLEIETTTTPRVDRKASCKRTYKHSRSPKTVRRQKQLGNHHYRFSEPTTTRRVRNKGSRKRAHKRGSSRKTSRNDSRRKKQLDSYHHPATQTATKRCAHREGSRERIRNHSLSPKTPRDSSQRKKQFASYYRPTTETATAPRARRLGSLERAREHSRSRSTPRDGSHTRQKQLGSYRPATETTTTPRACCADSRARFCERSRSRSTPRDGSYTRSKQLGSYHPATEMATTPRASIADSRESSRNHGRSPNTLQDSSRGKQRSGSAKERTRSLKALRTKPSRDIMEHISGVLSSRTMGCAEAHNDSGEEPMLLHRLLHAWLRVVWKKRYWRLHNGAETYIKDLQKQLGSHRRPASRNTTSPRVHPSWDRSRSRKRKNPQDDFSSKGQSVTLWRKRLKYVIALLSDRAVKKQVFRSWNALVHLTVKLFVWSQRDRVQVAEAMVRFMSRNKCLMMIRSVFKTWKSQLDGRKKRSVEDHYIDVAYGALLSCGQDNLTVTTCFYRWKEVTFQSAHNEKRPLQNVAQRTVGLQVSEKGTSEQLLNRMKSLLVEKSAKVETLTVANDELYQTTKEMAAEFAQASEKVTKMEKQLKSMVSAEKHAEEVQNLKKEINSLRASAKANKSPIIRPTLRQKVFFKGDASDKGTDDTPRNLIPQKEPKATTVNKEPSPIEDVSEPDASSSPSSPSSSSSSSSEEERKGARKVPNAFRTFSTAESFVRKSRSLAKVKSAWLPRLPSGQFAPVFARLTSGDKALEMLKAGFHTKASRQGLFRRRRTWYMFIKGLVDTEDAAFLFRCDKKEHMALAKPSKAYALEALRDALYNRDKSAITFDDGTVLRKVPAAVFDALMVCVHWNMTELTKDSGSDSS